MFSFLRRRRPKNGGGMSPQMQRFANEINGEIEAGFDQMRKGFAGPEMNADEERPTPQRAVG